MSGLGSCDFAGPSHTRRPAPTLAYEVRGSEINYPLALISRLTSTGFYPLVLGSSGA